MKLEIKTIRIYIGLFFLIVSGLLFYYFSIYYLDYKEQLNDPEKLWFYQLFLEDSIPQLVLSSILAISSIFFLLKSKISYYLFTFFFVGVIADSTYVTFVSERILEGVVIRFYLPVFISILLLASINLKAINRLFEFGKVRLLIIILIVILAIINSLNTREFNNIRRFKITTAYYSNQL